MGILIWGFVSCLPVLAQFSLEGSQYVSTAERNRTREVRAFLEKQKYKIVGTHMQLVNEADQRVVAEFDLLVRDAAGRLIIVEMKELFRDNKRSRKQVERALSFIQKSSPFTEPVYELLIISFRPGAELPPRYRHPKVKFISGLTAR